MAVQRMIEFETTSAEGADRVDEAVREAFRALSEQQPDGVRLAYWRAPGGRRFVALIELADESTNPLLGVDAARALPEVIGGDVAGGYPRPEVVEAVGTYGF